MKTQNPFDTEDLEKEIKMIKMKEYKWKCLICNKNYSKGAYCVENHFRKVHQGVKVIYKEDEDDGEIANWDLVYLSKKDEEDLVVLQAILKERQRLKSEVEKIIYEIIIEQKRSLSLRWSKREIYCIKAEFDRFKENAKQKLGLTK